MEGTAVLGTSSWGAPAPPFPESINTDSPDGATNRTAETAMYRTVQRIREAMIPIGTSRWGLIASSAWVETESKPM